MISIAHVPTRPADAPVVSQDGITFRRVASLDEYQECVAIQEEIWGPGFKELVPSAMLMVAQKMAGVCAAAFGADGRMLGFVFGISGFRDGVPSHWSDMMAVRREARGAHVGERLKLYQRELCTAVGINTMYWTFDPLVARNAHLNLMRLGARPSEYVVNMYGSNTGSPLHGSLETDRWIAAWDLTQAVPPLRAAATDAVLVVRPTTNGLVPAMSAFVDVPAVRVAIPPDHELLPLESRVEWRMATRAALLHYLGHGYVVTRFQRAAGDQPPYYELARA